MSSGRQSACTFGNTMVGARAGGRKVNTRYFSVLFLPSYRLPAAVRLPQFFIAMRIRPLVSVPRRLLLLSRVSNAVVTCGENNRISTPGVSCEKGRKTSEKEHSPETGLREMIGVLTSLQKGFGVSAGFRMRKKKSRFKPFLTAFHFSG